MEGEEKREMEKHRELGRATERQREMEGEEREREREIKTHSRLEREGETTQC